jgi:hypothetical protein
MAISSPNVNAEDYFIDDSVEAEPKHGTTVQAGWDALNSVIKPKRENKDYPTDFKWTEEARLIWFLGDSPFAVYKQHWIDRTEGRRSFVCTGTECPLCNIAGDIPRPKAAFNVLVLSDETPNVQILTASTSLAKQLEAAHVDPRRGPLAKHFWAVSRIGRGLDTSYTLDRVRASELAEEWELDPDEVTSIANNAVKYDATAIFVAPNEEMVEVARQLVG